MNLSSTDGIDLVGYLGAACVLCAFSVRRLWLLRSISIMGNFTFIVYAWMAAIHPVLLMNTMLLILNALRLSQAVMEANRARRAADGGRAGKLLSQPDREGLGNL